MTNEIPQYGLKAYALLFTRHGSDEEFSQSDLDWLVRQSMKKKIFSLLLKAGWIKKRSREKYVCINPEKVVKGLLDFKVPNIIKTSERSYAFTDLSAIEIWSDYSYVQRGIEKSPYFINILKKDLRYWKLFFSKQGITFYVNEGATIGEYVILKPVDDLRFIEKDGIKVISLSETERFAGKNDAYAYAYKYIREKYGSIRNKRE